MTGGGTELSIGPGTMYVGGLRVQLAATVQQSAQPDWKDTATDPLWVPPGDGALTASLALLAIEQEITAVEDPALREVALGGPDSAARTRMLQRFAADVRRGDELRQRGRADRDLLGGPRPHLQRRGRRARAALAPQGHGAQHAARGLALRSAVSARLSRRRQPDASVCRSSAYNPATQTGRLLWG